MWDDPRNLPKLRESLLAYYNDLAGYLNSYGQPIPPQLGSKAALELETDSAWTEPLHTAHSQGQSLFSSACEHLAAFISLLDEPLLTIVPWTCVRTGLETAALATWLLDSRIDARARVSRSLGRRIKGLEEQVKVWNASSEPRLIDHARARLAAAHEQAARIGVTVEKSGTATDSIGRMLGEEWAYRALSAIVHGHSWALIEFGFKANRTPGQRLHRMEKHMDPLKAVMFGSKLAFATARSAWHFVHLFGLSTNGFKDLVDHYCERMDAEPRDPFWRDAPT